MGDISSHKGISGEYLSKVLAPISGVAKLKISSISPIGTGQMAESYRVKFLQESGEKIESVVVKVPSQNVNSRSASRATRCYELETSFYSSLRNSLKVDTPKCFHVWYDALSDDFVLVLEDIKDANQGDQITGATVEQADAAINQLVNLHAPMWGSEKLNQIEWLPKHSLNVATGTSQLLRSVFAGFAERFAEKVNSEIISLGERLVSKIDRYYGAFPTLLTVAHRDFRLDNLLFTPQGNKIGVKVVDWQTVGAMPGASDLGYFIGASFTVEGRRDYEQTLVQSYCERLAAQKIDVSNNEIWAQYRLLGTSGYIMAIVASMLVKQTDRGDAMFAVMANRHGQQMLDLETEKLFA
ncbi:MAG: phosphotransferase family protein [Ilumatobacteraceae bacterium]